MSQLRGNPGKRKPNLNEPKPEALGDLPAPPAWLNVIAVAEWNRIGPDLVKLGLLTHLDLHTFAGYCQAFAEVVECQATIDGQGLLFFTDKGNAIQHPLVGIRNKAQARCRQFGADLGLSPSARTGLNVTLGGGATVDPMADFAGEKHGDQAGD